MKIEYTMVDFHGSSSASSFPSLTPSMRIALKDLRLEGLVVLHPGTASYPLGDRVRVMPLAALAGGTVDTLFPPRRTEGRQWRAPSSPQKRAKSKRLAEVSRRALKESPRVNAEFAAIEKDPDA